MIIESERLVLRPWHERDRDSYAALMGDPQVRRFYPSALTRAEADAQFERHLAMQKENPLHFRAAFLRESDAFVGMIGIAKIDKIFRNAIPTHPEMEIGWVFNSAFWGQGLASEAAQTLFDVAWSVGLTELVAFTAEINKPSQRVMEKAGMTRDYAADFEHPAVAADHPLRPHVLYRIANPSN